MRKLTQPWKLRRSFGSQPVGSVAGPRWPEAGITAQQIPSLPSRWAFRGQGDADLATLVVDDHRRANQRTLVRPNSGVSYTFKWNIEEFASSRASRKRHDVPCPSNSPKVYLGVISWHYTVPVTPAQFQTRVTSLFRLLIENRFSC